jgi:hypothetical protein
MSNDLTIEFLEDSHLFVRSGLDEWCIVLEDDAEAAKAVEQLVEKLRLKSLAVLKTIPPAETS